MTSKHLRNCLRREKWGEEAVWLPAWELGGGLGWLVGRWAEHRDSGWQLNKASFGRKQFVFETW